MLSSVIEICVLEVLKVFAFLHVFSDHIQSIFQFLLLSATYSQWMLMMFIMSSWLCKLLAHYGLFFFFFCCKCFLHSCLFLPFTFLHFFVLKRLHLSFLCSKEIKLFEISIRCSHHGYGWMGGYGNRVIIKDSEKHL